MAEFKEISPNAPAGEKLMNWVDNRFPATSLFKAHMSEYYASKNLNIWYVFGALSLLVLVIQIVTGIFLVMHYKPDANLAFASVEYIMRDVEYGSILRLLHSTGASAFFIVVYLHMFRGLLYGSYQKPRELVWVFGMLIYLALMAEAFMGYLLPWGQMSYWGAQVIISLFGAIPLIGYTLQDAASVPDIDGVLMLRASQLRAGRSGGTEFHLECALGASQIKTQLVGHFNISNALGVMGALLAKGLTLRAAIEALEALQAAPGRMQQVGGQDAPLIVIDYAHTPDALEKTLVALRSVASDRGGQLWCVFGCGGDRDVAKRPLMAAAAEQHAQHVVLTSDNPRSEDPQIILNHMLAGMQHAQRAIVIADRAQAIAHSVQHARVQDVVLVAGKGHEDYQDIAGVKHPFSDVLHAREALSQRRSHV